MGSLPIAIAKNDDESSATYEYLDIETTGLSPSYHDITVVGIFLVNGSEGKLVQLVGKQVKKKALLESLDGVDTIYTYNGQRFDLPFIHACVGVDLNKMHVHHDLMYECWRNDLRGGFKAVEAQLGIPRQLKGIGGYEAVLLWWRYRNHDDSKALALLLEYNKEDVMNLKALRDRLDENGS
jgi:uncharacterized protein YprB with RNaseH-like and TPR domain